MSGDNRLTRHRWVRIMSEFSAEGVWDRDGRCCPDDELPISSGLRERLRAWQRRFDQWYPRPWSEPGEFPPFDIRDFSREGLEIAKAVKEELPDWTVIYFDEMRHGDVIFRGASEDRSYFEYEVTPGPVRDR